MARRRRIVLGIALRGLVKKDLEFFLKKKGERERESKRKEGGREKTTRFLLIFLFCQQRWRGETIEIPSLFARLDLDSRSDMTTTEMTTPPASGGNGNTGARGAPAADPDAAAAAAAAAADDDIDDAAGAQREPRQERSPAVATAAAAPGSEARDEIFTWEAPHATYALGWSVSCRF